MNERNVTINANTYDMLYGKEHILHIQKAKARINTPYNDTGIDFPRSRICSGITISITKVRITIATNTKSTNTKKLDASSHNSIFYTEIKYNQEITNIINHSIVSQKYWCPSDLMTRRTHKGLLR